MKKTIEERIERLERIEQKRIDNEAAKKCERPKTTTCIEHKDSTFLKYLTKSLIFLFGVVVGVILMRIRLGI